MALIVSEGKSFTPPPAGTHLAICCQIIDLGRQYSKFYDSTAHKVLMAWELPDEKQEDGKPFMVYARYTMSLGKNSKLRGALEAWRGRAFSAEELKGFDLKNVLGKACMLNVAHRESEGNVYADVAGIMALPKNTIVPPATVEQVWFDLTEWKQEVFDKFSDKLKETINSSEERKPKPDEKPKIDPFHKGPISSIEDELPLPF